MFHGQPAGRIYRNACISITLVLFLFTTIMAFAIDEIHSATGINGPDPGTISAFDALSMTEDSSGARGCAATAAVRWLPGTTLTLNYVRDDFSESELAAFHDAVRRWRQALSIYQSGNRIE